MALSLTEKYGHALGFASFETRLPLLSFAPIAAAGSTVERLKSQDVSRYDVEHVPVLVSEDLAKFKSGIREPVDQSESSVDPV